MRTLTLAALTLIALTPIATVAQTDGPRRTGPREVLPAAREIALARSAAPPEISSDATVLTWNGADFDVAARGTNGVTCYVARSWSASLEPHCFDAEGSASILRIHILELRLQVQGLDEAAIDHEIDAALARGDLRLPTRPAMSYMMSAGQKLISDDGRPVGAWQPHIMLYYPGLEADAMGLGTTTAIMAGVVTDSGTPFSSLMVVVPDFVPVTGEEGVRAP
jgi:hypothetical protein